MRSIAMTTLTSRARVLFAAAGCAALAGVMGSRGVSSQEMGPVRIEEARLSQPTYKMRVERDVRVAMRDGVELSTDVYRPDAEGRFPVLVLRTPYGKLSSAGQSGGADGPYQPEYYVKRGYVVVLQDSRGRYQSAGQFEPFRDDANDGFDTDEWLGRQPW